jgi:hypothetical protein
MLFATTVVSSGVFLQQSSAGFPAWLLFLVLAILCLLIGLFRLGASQKSASTTNTAVSRVQVASIERGGSALSRQTNDLRVWDETAISRHLDDLRGQSPAVVSHYVESLKTRWVLNQNDKTAAARARFLKTKVEELKLFKEGQQIMVDLEALALEREKRLKTLQLENAQLDDIMRTRSEREQLAALKERKQLELEIAKLDKEIRELNSPTKAAEPELSGEEKRAKERQACEQRLANYKAEKQKALQIDDADERVLRVNAIDDAIQREMERWAKLL